MKIEIDVKELTGALRILKNAIDTKSQLAVLSHVKVESSPDSVRITATDLEQAITVNVDAIADGIGAVTVPHKALLAAVKTLKKGTVTLEIDGTAVTVRAGATSVIHGGDVKDYPEIPAIDRRRMSLIPEWAARALIDRVICATSYDETRFVLNGILFHCNGKIETVATDGRRLARLELPVKAANYEGRFILPRMTAGTLSAVLNSKSGGDMRFDVVPSDHWQFKAVIGSDVEVISRLIDGHYPNFEQVMPKSFDGQAAIDRANFLNALESVTANGAKPHAPIKLSLSPNVLQNPGKLSLEYTLRGDVSRAEVDAHYDGPGFEILANPLYLIDALRTMPPGAVRFQFTTAQNPGELQPHASSDYRYVFMPMKS